MIFFDKIPYVTWIFVKVILVNNVGYVFSMVENIYKILISERLGENILFSFLSWINCERFCFRSLIALRNFDSKSNFSVTASFTLRSN